MQLRKCCNHPYLLEHPLDPETGDLVLNDGVMKNAGKMLVLDMMLKALKERGHKVTLYTPVLFSFTFGKLLYSYFDYENNFLK